MARATERSTSVPRRGTTAASAKRAIPAAKKKASAKKSPAKKATVRAAPKKSAKPAKKKAPAKKKPTAKKPAAKKPAKAPVKKKVVKKAAAPRKSAAVTASAKKAPPKKGSAKKASPKKAAAAKAAAKKVAPKKAAAPPEPKPKPRKKAKPEVTPAEIRKIKVALEEQRTTLMKEYTDLQEDTFNASQSESSGEASFDEEYADAGSYTFEREKDLSIGQNIQDLVDKVNQALRAIDEGTYGICERCGNPIAKARIQALPYSTLCLSCKQIDERSR